MRKYFFIASGGILGAVLRYAIKGAHIFGYTWNLPLNTLIVNITGSFILALLLTTALEVREFDADLRLGIATGFLGAYTTFSTMCKEFVGLMDQGLYYPAVSYMLISTVLGLGAAYLGALLARKGIARLVKQKKDETREILKEKTDGEVD